MLELHLFHLPSVGRNFSDHAVVGNMWPVNSTDALETLVRDPVVATNALPGERTVRVL